MPSNCAATLRTSTAGDVQRNSPCRLESLKCVCSHRALGHILYGTAIGSKVQHFKRSLPKNEGLQSQLCCQGGWGNKRTKAGNAGCCSEVLQTFLSCTCYPAEMAYEIRLGNEQPAGPACVLWQQDSWHFKMELAAGSPHPQLLPLSQLLAPHAA